jgi:phage-related protein
MNEQLKIIISAEIDKLKKNIKEGKRLIDNFGEDSEKVFTEFNDEIQKVGDVAKKGLAVAGAAIAGAATALLALADSTLEYRTAQAKLSAAFETAGGTAEQAKTTYNDLYRVLGDGDVAVEAANHLAKLTTNEQDLAEWTTICQGVYATFGDSLPIEGLAEAANETAKTGAVTGGLADALNWAGVSEEEFQAKLDACATEQEREALIRETLNSLYSDAAANYETTAAAILEQNEAQAKLDESMAAIGEAMQPINTALTEFAAKILDEITPILTQFMEEHGPAITETLDKVATAIGNVLSWLIDNWDLVSTIGTIILAIAAALTVFSTVMGIVNAVMMASPVTWIVLAIVAAIAALVAIIVVVIKYWDEIKAATLAVWEAIKNAVQAAIDWIVGFFKGLIDFVKENWQALLLMLVNPFAGAFKLLYDNCEGFRNMIDNFIAKVKDVIAKGFNIVKEKIIQPIKNAFDSVKQTFSNIFNTIKDKLNAARDFVKGIIDKIKSFFNFKVELPKIKLPHFAIKPSGWQLGDLLKGSIPSLGIEWYAEGGVFESPTLFSHGTSLGGLGEDGAEAIVPLEKNTEWLDRIAEMLNEKQGSQPIVLQVDGKTFAQISVDSINQLTRQRGSLALNLV